jgi:hypothetical protein
MLVVVSLRVAVPLTDSKTDKTDINRLHQLLNKLLQLYNTRLYDIHHKLRGEKVMIIQQRIRIDYGQGENLYKEINKEAYSEILSLNDTSSKNLCRWLSHRLLPYPVHNLKEAFWSLYDLQQQSEHQEEYHGTITHYILLTSWKDAIKTAYCLANYISKLRCDFIQQGDDIQTKYYCYFNVTILKIVSHHVYYNITDEKTLCEYQIIPIKGLKSIKGGYMAKYRRILRNLQKTLGVAFPNLKSAVVELAKRIVQR